MAAGAGRCTAGQAHGGQLAFYLSLPTATARHGWRWSSYFSNTLVRRAVGLQGDGGATPLAQWRYLPAQVLSKIFSTHTANEVEVARLLCYEARGTRPHPCFRTH